MISRLAQLKLQWFSIIARVSGKAILYLIQPTYLQQDKVALVTDGTSGIGRTTVIAFGAAGAKVVFSGRRDAEGEKTAKLIRERGAECLYVH